MTLHCCEPQRSLAMTLRIGAYELIRELGRGGMGVVYLARETELERDVALKFLADGYAHDAHVRTRFLLEARAMARVSDPHVVPIYAVGETEGRPYFAMEYLSGQSLETVLQLRQKLSVQDAANCVLQAAQGLQAAHEAGVIHRDIKPGNLLLTNKGQIKVADFGIAHSSGLSKRLTATGGIVGTQAYLSPEACMGQPADARSDQFALGVVFYELLTGRQPFYDPAPLKSLISIVEQALPPLHDTLTPLPTAVDFIVRRLLSKAPNDRFTSMAHLVEALIAAGIDARSKAITPMPDSEAFHSSTPRTPLSEALLRAHAKSTLDAGRSDALQQTTEWPRAPSPQAPSLQVPSRQPQSPGQRSPTPTTQVAMLAPKPTGPSQHVARRYTLLAAMCVCAALAAGSVWWFTKDAAISGAALPVAPVATPITAKANDSPNVAPTPQVAEVAIERTPPSTITAPQTEPTAKPASTPKPTVTSSTTVARTTPVATPSSRAPLPTIAEHNPTTAPVDVPTPAPSTAIGQDPNRLPVMLIVVGNNDVRTAEVANRVRRKLMSDRVRFVDATTSASLQKLASNGDAGDALIAARGKAVSAVVVDASDPTVRIRVYEVNSRVSRGGWRVAPDRAIDSELSEFSLTEILQQVRGHGG